MFNEKLFLDHNSGEHIKKIKTNSQKTYIYTTRSQQVDLLEIKRIINFLYSIKCRHKLSFFPIVIDLGKNIVIEDKLTYILLECICYHLIVKERCNLSLRFHCPHTIYNEGIKVSYLKCIDGTKKGMAAFVDHFSFEIRGPHFRNIVQSEDFDGEQTARIVQDIDSFLKFNLIQKSYGERVSEIIGELLDNSLEHSMSDCLIDIDVTKNYEKNSDPSSENLYCGVNIVVLNFSDILLGNGVAKKIQYTISLGQTDQQVNQRYLDVLGAREYHSNYWNENYCESDFNIIASFQHKISCRLDRFSTGGTGLTRLIRGLEDESDAYECYMLSGRRKVNFIKSMLTYDKNNWVGFNLEGDFLGHIPSPECITNSNLYFPGTAYNLNFVMKREADYGTKN